MSEEELAFLVIGFILSLISLSIFRINIFVGVLVLLFCGGFWWTLFFVFFGR